MDYLASLHPEVEEMYPRSRPVEIMFMPEVYDREATKVFKTTMKVNISDDNLIFLDVPTPFEIGVYENWE